MPDGLDRDSLGNVWVGLLGLRSTTTDWIHAHPWIKPLLLRLPTHWIPRREATGILALGPDMTRALYLGLHEGSSVHDVSVAIPAEGRIYLASFDPDPRSRRRTRAGGSLRLRRAEGSGYLSCLSNNSKLCRQTSSAAVSL